MTAAQRADHFVVVNGPEDGAEFELLRAPFDIGHDPSCAVHIRLDTAVRRFHAHVSVVSEGYRIRRADTAPVYVNGKRAGVLWSRIVRDGGYVVAGNTMLCLECAPDGLARRNHGIDMESDLVWGAREGVRGLFRLTRSFLHFLHKVFGRIFGFWLIAGLLACAAYLYSPGCRSYVNYAVWWVRQMLPDMNFLGR